MCYEKNQKPHLLRCGHEFCLDCLSAIAAHHVGGRMECPICRRVTKVSGGISELPQVRVHTEILEKLEEAAANTIGRRTCRDCGSGATRWCCDCCRNICDTCTVKYGNNGHKNMTIYD